MVLDGEIVKRIEHLTDRFIEFKKLRLTSEGLTEFRRFHYDEIEKRCAEKKLPLRKYIELYDEMANNNLEKRCIRRTFPQVVDEKCDKPCRGYDKFCVNYVPTATFNFSQIEEVLDYRDAQQTKR